jgi:hypothetical protein
MLSQLVTSQNLFSICLRFVPSYPIPDPLGREMNFTTDIGEILLIVFSAVIQTFSFLCCVFALFVFILLHASQIFPVFLDCPLLIATLGCLYRSLPVSLYSPLLIATNQE